VLRELVFALIRFLPFRVFGFTANCSNFSFPLELVSWVFSSLPFRLNLPLVRALDSLPVAIPREDAEHTAGSDFPIRPLLATSAQRHQKRTTCFSGSCRV
jgi:hypothetical protein